MYSHTCNCFADAFVQSYIKMGYSPSNSGSVEAFEIAITLSSLFHLTQVQQGLQVHE